MTGAAWQWENWIAEQAAAIVRRETAPAQAWENEGGSQRAASSLPYPLTRCRWCSTAIHILDLVVSGLHPSQRRTCCMSCHRKAYPEDRRDRLTTALPS